MSIPATPCFASSSTTYLTPRERMRLAKASLLEEEDCEMEGEMGRRVSERFEYASSVTPPTGSARGKFPKASILRRTSTSSEWSSPPPDLPLPPTPDTPSPHLHHVPLPPDEFARAMRRRSSRVRFSDQELGPTPDGSPGPSNALLRRESTSALDGLREDLGKTRRSLSLAYRRRSSAESVGSTSSDPFALFSSPLSSSLSSLPTNADEDEAFKPLPLPYPKLSRPDSIISLTSSDQSGFPSTDEPRSSTSSVLASPAQLRDIVNRPSHATSTSGSSRLSLENCASVSKDTVARLSSTSLDSPEYLRDLLARPSLLSILSATSSDSAGPAILRDMLERSSLDSASVSGRHSLTRASILSIASALLSECDEFDNIPKLNRATWISEEVGLSPRSGPTPILGSRQSMEASLAETTPPITPYELERSPLDLAGERLASIGTSSGRLDSIDLLPLVDIDVASKGHSRNDSTLSAVMNFPIPPDRFALQVSYTDVGDEGTGQLGLHSGEESSLEISLDTPKPTADAIMACQMEGEEIPAPSSPKLQDSIKRFRERRSISRRMSGEDSGEESDLDLNEDIILSAAKSRIISPSSSLLASSKSRSRRSVRGHYNAGWSGSESEEDGYISAMRDITLRKLSGSPRAKTKRSITHPTLTLPTAPTSQSPRTPPAQIKSLPLDRLSHLSYTSDTSHLTASSTDTNLLTPCPSNTSTTSNLITDEMRGFMQTARAKMLRSASCSSDIGDFPWGKSASPPNTPTKSDFGEALLVRGHVEGTGFYEGLLAGLEGLPVPKLKVDGWGMPEVLMDGLLGSDSDGEVVGLRSGPRIPRPSVTKRSSSPHLRVSALGEDWLRDEKEPEWEEVVVPPKRVSSLGAKSSMRAPSVSRFAKMSVI